MATIKQIVLKAVQLKDAAEILESHQDAKAKAQTQMDAAQAQIDLQLPVVQALKAELVVLVNE